MLPLHRLLAIPQAEDLALLGIIATAATALTKTARLS